MKKIFYLLLLFCCTTIGCSSSSSVDDNTDPEIPTDVGGTTNTSSKRIQMWIDADANFSRFSTQSNITSYLAKMKDTGIREIYLDVKPGSGYALYESSILPKLKTVSGVTVERDWDYLGFWIDEAEKYGIKVIASISTLGYGDPKTKTGLIYDSNTWNGKTQMMMVNNDPTNIVDMRNQTNVDAVMLNPCLVDVQNLVISVVEEIVKKYPKLKGICLDYCRWYGLNYGLEDASIAAFEAYSGEKVSNRNNIITASGGVGPQFKKWIEFRSMTITNLITNIRSRVKSVNSNIELHLWASADWGSRYSVGQNWASKTYIPSGGVYSDTYSKTGFADQLDVFSLGAYSEYVWSSENPGSVWSVQNFVTTYSNYVKGSCKVCGSIAAYAYGSDASDVSDAVYLCLKNTDGLMVFDISHVINNNQWSAIKDGISRVIK